MIKCTECGYENMDGLELCDSCGGKLSPAAAPATDAAAPTPSASETPSAEVPPAAPPQSAPAADAPTGELAKPADAGAPATPLQPPAAAAAMVRAKLVIARGGRQGHEFPLEAGNNLIGRWDPETGSFPEVDLEQDDPEAKISRKHALIRIDGANVTVEDIGSLNGTYVNRGQRLTPGAPANLKTGDEIIVGKTFFKVSIDPIS